MHGAEVVVWRAEWITPVLDLLDVDWSGKNTSIQITKYVYERTENSFAD